MRREPRACVRETHALHHPPARRPHVAMRCTFVSPVPQRTGAAATAPSGSPRQGGACRLRGDRPLPAVSVRSSVRPSVARSGMVKPATLRTSLGALVTRRRGHVPRNLLADPPMDASARGCSRPRRSAAGPAGRSTERPTAPATAGLSTKRQRDESWDDARPSCSRTAYPAVLPWGSGTLRRVRSEAATCTGVASPGYAASPGFLDLLTLPSA